MVNFNFLVEIYPNTFQIHVRWLFGISEPNRYEQYDWMSREGMIYSHQFHQRLDDPRGEEIWMKRHRPCEGHLVGAGGNSYRRSSWLQNGGPTYWHSYPHIEQLGGSMIVLISENISWNLLKVFYFYFANHGKSTTHFKSMFYFFQASFTSKSKMVIQNIPRWMVDLVSFNAGNYIQTSHGLANLLEY